MNNKFKFNVCKNSFTKVELNGKTHTLARIIATSDFGNVKKGELGGYIENLNCLSQYGNSWIGGNAIVLDGAKIMEDAVVYDNVTLSNVLLTGKSRLMGQITILSETEIIINSSSEIMTFYVDEDTKPITFCPRHRYINTEHFNGSLETFLTRQPFVPTLSHYESLRKYLVY